MDEKKFSLTPADPKQDIASCAVCFARNYDSKYPDAIGKRVDRLYELRIGSIVLRLCDDCLDQLGGMIAAAQREREELPEAGDEVWIVERDEDGRACDVSGYMFIAKSDFAVIVSTYIGSRDDIESTLAYHIEETAENYDTDLAVFPAEDCYTTKEAAMTVLREEKGEDEE